MQCDDSLLGDFLDESNELMQRLNEDMLRLDELVRSSGEAFDLDLLNNMFRSAHSIKGLSAMLGFSKINTLVHRVENLFDSARGRRLVLTPDVIDVVFAGLDCLSHLVDAVRRNDGSEFESEPTLIAIDNILAAAHCKVHAKTQAEMDAELKSLRAAASPAEPVAKATLPTATSDTSDPFAEIVDEPDVAPKYLSIFIDETELSLDRLSETLMRAEAGASPDITDELLVTAHRIKGSAASLGLLRVTKLAHLMEDTLQERRDQGGQLGSPLVDVLLQCTDAIRLYNASLMQGQPDTSAFAAAAHALVGARDIVPEPAPLPDWAQLLLRNYQSCETPAHVGRVRFEDHLPLAGLKGSLVYEKLAQAGRVIVCQPTPDTLEELDELPLLSFVLESFELPGNLRTKLHIAGVRQIELFAVPVSSSDDRRTEVAVNPVDPAAAVSSGMVSAEERASVPTPAAKEPAAVRDADSKPAETLRVDVERLDHLMNLSGQLVINKARLNRIGDGLRQSLPQKKASHNLDGLAELARRMAAELERTSSAEVPALESFRSMFRQLTGDLEHVQTELRGMNALRGQLNELFDSLGQLDRVTCGIQKSVMDTRMIAIGPLFQRFKRVVRDITRGNGKEIQLLIHGENTELDKRMIDELGDPLVHMVRNSADHGIESPAERVARGKPRHGTITLNAYQRGSRIVIEVCDDGKGLDRDRILAKAIEKNIISAADAETLTPQQVFALIWEPGFSTAEKITEISGRGMGMDIVRSKIEGIKGTIQIDSTPGQGCRFTIVLPLTMAILPSLMVTIDGGVFSLPLESVREIVSVEEDHIVTVQGMPTLRVRDRIISLVQLEEVLAWNHPAPVTAADSQEPAVVILEYEGRELGLMVHHLLGEEDVVIESMSEIYGEIQGVAGASILGDGRVSLILDVGALLHLSCRRRTVRSGPSTSFHTTGISS